MINENFTQGEWEIESIEIEGSQAPVLRFSILCIPVKGEKFDLSNDAMISNAALIKAAPKMYSKLKTVLALCEGNLLRKTNCDILGGEIANLLKKARGEE